MESLHLVYFYRICYISRQEKTMLAQNCEIAGKEYLWEAI